MNNFAIFIMVYGRPEKEWTYETLIRQGYTGKIYFVGDNTDSEIINYKNKYGNKLIIFDKIEEAKKYDFGDNSCDYRTTLVASNVIMEIAKNMKLQYFMIMCDDYVKFEFRYLNKEKTKLLCKKVNNLDDIFNYYLDFYKSTNFTTLAFAQGGDFIGGANNPYAIKMPLIRKAMNTFICSVDRPFKFVGRLNEDVTTYVKYGSIGYLFGTIPLVSIVQKQTQQQKNGLSEVYTDNGTYIKSFFTLMYNPSCVKIATLDSSNKRIHHLIKWQNAVPVIISQKNKKYE